MAVIGAQDFKYGLDRRRPRAAGAPGTLWDCQNAHITRGGDIESMRAFVPAYTFPMGTFGLAQAAGQLYTFGSLDLAASMPVGVQYVRCLPGEASAVLIITGGTSSPGVNKMTQITAGATNLMSAPVDWATSNSATATAIAANITANVANGGYTAAANANVIVIVAAAGRGSAANGIVLTPTPAGNVTAYNTNFIGGISANMVRVLHAKAFQSKVYVIAEFSDGMIRHFYNGVRVGDWDTLGDGNSTVNTLATYLASKISADSTVSVSASANVVIVSANVAGVPFTVSATAINVGPLSGTPATGTVTITGGTLMLGVNKMTQITAGATNLMSAPVDWATSNSATATAIAANITANVANGGYTAIGTGGTVLVSAPTGQGAVANGVVVAATPAGNVTDTTTNFAFGVTATVDNQTAVIATVQVNVPAVTEVQASSVVTITGGSSNPGIDQVSQITAGGVNLMAKPVDWLLSNEATAAAVSAAINANATANGGYTASEIAGVMTILAPPGQGAIANGIVVMTTANGVSTTTTNFAGGVSVVTAVAQVSTVTLGGAYDTGDLYTITVNGVAYAATGRASGTGTVVFVYRQRIYSPANTFLEYCALNTASDWHNASPASGAGFIDFSSLMDGSERISGLAVYAGLVAIFLPKTILIYNLAPDATTVSQVQLIPNTGTIAGLSALQFGLDSFYLDSTGVRSVRARDISNVAITNDIGTVLDPFIQSWVASVGIGVAQAAEAVIEPFDARYWLAIGTRIFVLSLFTTAQVSAWSYYDIGIAFSSFTRIYNKLYARSGNIVYLYGGPQGSTYPAKNAAPVTAATPFISAGSPTSFREWGSFDMACNGAWTVTFLVDPDDETAEIQYGTAVNTTYSGSLNATVGRTPLLAIRFNCSSGGQVTLSSFSAAYRSVGDK